jgi:hypothetical protein
MRFISESAAKYGMATGLKNAMDLLKEMRPYVHFAVNEQCSNKRECEQYKDFKKPVFHIEYPLSDRELKSSTGLSATIRRRYCVDTNRVINDFFHTVIKNKALDGIVQYCDGKYYKTPTKVVKGGRTREQVAYVVEDDGTVPVKSWQMDPDMIGWQLNVAQEDGYPFERGRGSDALISDADLVKTYDTELVVEEAAAPELHAAPEPSPTPEAMPEYGYEPEPRPS